MGHSVHNSDIAEYEFIRQLVSVHSKEQGRRVLEEGPDELDWPKVALLAGYHRVLPALWIHLEGYNGNRVPPAVREYAHRQSVAGAIQALFLSAEMAKIAKEMSKAEVPFLVLKGPSLADAYQGIAHRPFVDNDILIRREDFSRLERLLIEMGFGRLKRSQNQLMGYLFIHGEYTFGRQVGGQRSTVDAHTSVAPYGYSYSDTYESLETRSRRIEVGGERLNALGWNDLFLVLCVNAIKDQWNRLRLASDLAEVGKCVEDWDHLEYLARQTRSLRAFRTGVLVATDEVGAAFPKEVVERARADSRVASLASHVQAHLKTFHQERVMSGGERARFVLQSQDDVRGQIRYLGYVALRRLTERLVDPHPQKPEPPK